MKGCTAATTGLVMLLVFAGCRSADRVPPSRGLVVPEPEPEATQAEPKPPSPDESSYVVDPQGDDSASGRADAPWQTLEHAASQVEPGDTVAVRSGRYRAFWLETSGEPERPIRFLAEKDAIIVGSDHRDGINLEGASHVEIRGFRVANASRAGIRAVECESVTIRDNTADRNGKWGIFTGFCDDLRIVDNEASRSEEEHGIYVSNTSERPLVRGNHIWGNRLAGLHMNGDESMGGAGVITEARILNNVIRENGHAGASGINLDGVRESLIANNLVYENGASGIALYRIDGARPSAKNAVIHNTVVMPERGARWALLLRNAATQTMVYNNILVSPDPRRGAIAASKDSLRGLQSDANLLTGRLSVDGGHSVVDVNTWRELTEQDAQSHVAPPPGELFSAPHEGDFRPAPGSPARAGGTPLPRSIRSQMPGYPLTDLAGRERPEQGAPDLGCYQASPAGGEEPAEAEVPGSGPAEGAAEGGADEGKEASDAGEDEAET